MRGRDLPQGGRGGGGGGGSGGDKEQSEAQPRQQVGPLEALSWAGPLARPTRNTRRDCCSVHTGMTGTGETHLRQAVMHNGLQIHSAQEHVLSEQLLDLLELLKKALSVLIHRRNRLEYVTEWCVAGWMPRGWVWARWWEGRQLWGGGGKHEGNVGISQGLPRDNFDGG